MVSAKANVDSLESKVSTSKIQQADANFLFNNANVSDVAVLNEQELAETKGEFWISFGIFTLVATAACGINCLVSGTECGNWETKGKVNF